MKRLIILLLISNYALADSSQDQATKYASASVYAVGCTLELPGQYKYIEKALSTINNGLRVYLKDNPDNEELIKETSLIKINEFKKLSSSDKYMICEKIDDNLRDANNSPTEE